jgi:polyribonucleotide nucleotidyltransferase
MGASDKEILTSRVIDRSLRPLFPKGKNEEEERKRKRERRDRRERVKEKKVRLWDLWTNPSEAIRAKRKRE